MKIGNFDLEKDSVYIIAELSANHNGNLQVALDTIKAAKEIGVNAIKLQTYTADTLTLNSDKDDFIIKGGTLWDDKKLYDLYKEAYLPWEWHEELFYKIASFEITDYELIRYAASKGRPMIISTGLLKCTSAYPAALDEANLKMIPNLAETFGVVSGFSDHTLGTTAPVVATALGAKVIEKHFILDKSIGGADADFSLDKEEFAVMVQAVRDTEKLLGKVDYSMTEKKRANRRFSRSLYVAKDIQKGEKFTEENIRSVRPGYGMHPKHFREILGKTAQHTYKSGERFELD